MVPITKSSFSNSLRQSQQNSLHVATWLALQSFSSDLSWLSSVLPGKCWNSTSNYVTTASFHILVQTLRPPQRLLTHSQPISHTSNTFWFPAHHVRPLDGPDKWQCDRRRGSSVRSDLTIEEYWFDPQHRQQMFSKTSTASCLLIGHRGHEVGQPSPSSARVKNEEVHLHASIHLQSEHFYTRNHVRATQTATGRYGCDVTACRRQCKVKVSLEQATKAQRGSRGMALLFL